MAEDSARTDLGAALIARAGGYLRNPVRQELVTCAVCTTPVAGYEHCYPCNRNRNRNQTGLADATAFLTYAVAGQQSGYVMRGYKANPPVGEHRVIVALLTVLALSTHGPCPGKLLGTDVTHWSTVPSLPAKAGEHPLHAIARSSAPGLEVPLLAAEHVLHPRDVNRQHFASAVKLPPGHHVLLIDDTWTGGGHSQSATLALREAGAAYVSILVVARWITTDFGDNASFIRNLADHDYDLRICPWTGSHCP